MTHIAFIGGGNMATSIIGGLLKQNSVSADQIHVSDPGDEQRQRLQTELSIHTHTTNDSAVEQADVVILAVKPQVMKNVLVPLQPLLKHNQPLLISIAAGINLSSLQSWSGCQSVVRCMPNTPALVGEGATAMFASDAVTIDQRNQTDSLLNSVGITLWVQSEDEIDAVTAVSGSGPAYYFLLMEAMIEAGQKLGLSQQTATQLTLQTALGAGRMAKQAEVAPDELRRQVTSPGGTTEKALETFADAHFKETVNAALAAARQRAKELSEELGD